MAALTFDFKLNVLNITVMRKSSNLYSLSKVLFVTAFTSLIKFGQKYFL